MLTQTVRQRVLAKHPKAVCLVTGENAYLIAVPHRDDFGERLSAIVRHT